jgi:hypothetical protein
MNQALTETMKIRQQEIIDSVEALVYEKDGIKYINMENYALDFHVPYQYHGFTKSGNVRLGYEINGRVDKKLGKVSNGYLHTDGHRYSARLNQ